MSDASHRVERQFVEHASHKSWPTVNSTYGARDKVRIPPVTFGTSLTRIVPGMELRLRPQRHGSYSVSRQFRILHKARALQEAPHAAPETGFEQRTPDHFGTPSTLIVPHRKFHLQPQRQGSHGVL